MEKSRVWRPSLSATRDLFCFYFHLFFCYNKWEEREGKNEEYKRNYSSARYHSIDRISLTNIRRYCIFIVTFHVYIRFVTHTYTNVCVCARHYYSIEEESDIFIFDIWSKSKVTVTLLSFIDFILLSLSFWNAYATKNKKQGIHSHIHKHFMHLSFFFVLDLFFFFSSLLFLIPILLLPFSIRVYILPFFFFICVWTHTHSSSPSFFCSFWWYTMGDEGKNCVCVCSLL